MSDRCSCTPHWQDAGGGYTEYVPEWETTCPAHGDVDALIAVGEYVDRRGVEWHRCECVTPACGMWHDGHPSSGVTPAQMRSRIEREQHRDMCPGLRGCDDHPTPRVFRYDGMWSALAQGRAYRLDTSHPTFAEAIAAAHNTTGDTQ